MFQNILLSHLRSNRYLLLNSTVGKAFYSKVVPNAKEALKDLKSGSRIMYGGFGICGMPEKMLEVLAASDVKDLTIISNNAGSGEEGLNILIKAKKVKKMIASYVGESPVLEKQYFGGDLEVELIPQGTLTEKIKAGGAGIPAFYTATGNRTWIQEGKMPMKYSKTGKVEKFSTPKEVREFNGREYLLEEAITADFSLIKAWKGDKYGNIVFRKSARNFNQPMATAGKITIAEVEELVEPGEIDPDQIHIPGVYIDRIFRGTNYVKPLEKITIKTDEDETTEVKYDKSKLSLREVIGQRAACELRDGMNVNLGIGIPTIISFFVPKNVTVFLQSENGISGVGDKPKKSEIDPDLTNAAKETSSVITGAAFYGSDTSFNIIRGGNLDITFLGCMEVSQYGDLANWVIPGKLIKGMGGAMDLVSNPATKVIIATEHCSKNGASKIVDKCTLPLTGYRVASKIMTEKAVFDVCPKEGLTLVEKLSTLTVEDIQKITACKFKVSPNLCDMKNIIFGSL